MEPTKQHPLSSFERLSQEVLLYRPSREPSPTKTTAKAGKNEDSTTLEVTQRRAGSSEPTLILLATWSGALDSHIAKYITKYKELFPTSEILLIKSTRKLFFRPSMVAEAIKPAIPVLKARFPVNGAATTNQVSSSLQFEPQQDVSETESPELLIHIFSMGGTSSLVRLLEAYPETKSTASSSPNSGPSHTNGDVLPPHIKILDSAPTIFRASSLVNFLYLPLPNLLPLRVLLAPLRYGLSYGWAYLVSLGIFTDPLANWGSVLNDPSKNETERGRAYMYGDKDVLVHVEDVENHGEQAKRSGFNVMAKEKFEGSRHVEHMRNEEARYWRVIQRAWEDSTTGEADVMRSRL